MWVVLCVYDVCGVCVYVWHVWCVHGGVQCHVSMFFVVVCVISACGLCGVCV